MLDNYVQVPARLTRTGFNEYGDLGITNTDASRGIKKFSHYSVYGPRNRSVANPFFCEKLTMNQHYIENREYYHRPSFIETTIKEEGDIISSQPFISLGYDLAEVDLSYNALLERLAEKVRGSIDLSIDIAQAGQTRRMLNATDQFTSFAKQTASRYRILKIPANLWLQYQYGWRPLLNTVYDAAMRSTEVATALMVIKVSHKVPKANCGISYDTNRSVRVNAKSRDAKISHRGSFRFSTLDPTSMANFTSLNPASIAWELVPYSFVVDWFLDIGGYLRNLETAMLYGSNFKDGYITRVIAGEITESSSFVDVGPDYEKLSTSVYNGSFSQVLRSPLSSYPYPRLPSFKADLGSSRLLSAASLLAVLLK
jgi:hypothetical protein